MIPRLSYFCAYCVVLSRTVAEKLAVRRRNDESEEQRRAISSTEGAKCVVVGVPGQHDESICSCLRRALYGNTTRFSSIRVRGYNLDTATYGGRKSTHTEHLEGGY